MTRLKAETKRLTVQFDGQEVFSRECTAFECEGTAAGKFTASASYEPISLDWKIDS
jgi:hypothetical protein